MIHGKRSMECTEKRKLFKEYDDAVQAYLKRVRELSDLTKISPHPEWELTWQLADEARKVCDISYKQLKAHVAQHRCRPHETAPD